MREYAVWVACGVVYLAFITWNESVIYRDNLSRLWRRLRGLDR